MSITGCFYKEFACDQDQLTDHDLAKLLPHEMLV